jgi:trigger factor
MRMHQISLGSYTNLPLPPAETFSEQELQYGVQQGLKKQMDQWAADNKPSSTGDEVTVNLQAMCDEMFVPELSGSNHKYTIGDPGIIEPFNLISGKKKGDVFSLEMFCPADFFVERLQEKTVVFEVEVVNVFFRTPLPEPSDEIARQIDPAVSGLDELLHQMRQTITANWQEIVQEKRDMQILSSILKQSSYTLDDAESEKLFDNLLKAKRLDSMTSGDIGSIINSDEKSLVRECRIQAKHMILEDLILLEIARLENLSIDQDELQTGRSSLLAFAPDESYFNQIFPSEKELSTYLLKEKVRRFLRESN